jgi:LCP family protein required for cell wall assembly
MNNPHDIGSTKQAEKPLSKRSSRRLWKHPLFWVPVIIVCLLAFSVGRLSRLLIAKPGEHSGGQNVSPIGAVGNLTQVALDPTAGFPGKNRLNILVMGIDDNWTDQNIVYTKNARTDTLFLLTLDLKNKKAAMLSIPRDSYVPIAGTNYSDKINSAYATGGPMRSETTVAHLTGVYPDYYIVLNINATKRLVDALGGVDVNVEHQMDYDDNWGHLHVHLKPGLQHLDGDEAMSFVRYRHGNHGLSSEDGDPRRIYRQHVLLRSMIEQAKTFNAAIRVNSLVDTAMSCVDTDLSRTQIADLAALFRGMQQSDVVTASLDGTDARGTDGAWLIVLDPVQVRDYVDWLVKGNEPAVWGITPVIVKSPGGRSVAANVVDQLQSAGFTDVSTGYADTIPGSGTTIVDTGVQDPNAANQIATILGLDSSAVIRKSAQPNHAGWTLPPQIIITLGTHAQTASSQTSPALPSP